MPCAKDVVVDSVGSRKIGFEELVLRYLLVKLYHFLINVAFKWGRSSAGRAGALQASGRRFDPDRLHH